jgi:hypothetical protein
LSLKPLDEAARRRSYGCRTVNDYRPIVVRPENLRYYGLRLALIGSRGIPCDLLRQIEIGVAAVDGW